VDISCIVPQIQPVVTKSIKVSNECIPVCQPEDEEQLPLDDAFTGSVAIDTLGLNRFTLTESHYYVKNIASKY